VEKQAVATQSKLSQTDEHYHDYETERETAQSFNIFFVDWVEADLGEYIRFRHFLVKLIDSFRLEGKIE